MKKELKNLVLCAPICVILIISCKKHDADVNPAVDCISEITPVFSPTAYPLTQANLMEIDNIFQQNNLSTADQQFYILDSAIIPSTGNNEIEVASYLWYNSLPVFEQSEGFIFMNGVLDQQASVIYTGSVPGPDTTFRQSLESVRTIWLDNYMMAKVYGGPAGDTTPRSAPASYRDSCLSAQRGYIDANIFNSTIPAATRLVKAWQVNPTGQFFPIVFIEDSTGTAHPESVSVP